MKKILIIDDDPDIREVLTTVLEGKYELREAGSREEGEQAVNEFLPDLVILDVMMEKHDSGFEMARGIKQNAKLKDVKILMSTNVDKEMKMDFKKIAGDPDWLPV
ncbi:response regulator, partial [candidate division KSB3 bacterium]|nr:response regulator [candidate division KSB3 bacterium]MBD3326661.1 response regulator [candidate division KSB3 bacterium]